MMVKKPPVFPGELCKNDALFMHGALMAKPFVRCYPQDRVEIVYGPSCKPEKEIILKRCTADGVFYQKRRGGGGTVILSPGMVVVIVVGGRRKGEGTNEIFTRIHQAIIGLLLPFTKDRVVQRGISDLAIGEKKIAGSSLYLGRRPDLYYYQSSIMVESDVSLIQRYLTHPPREPQYRNGRNHGDFCTTLRNEGSAVSVRECAELLNEKLAECISAP
jgi:lipoate-protein ligase A